MEDLHKPWWARSSFSAAVIGTVTALLASRRDVLSDEQIVGAVALWLNFVAFLRWAPSDKPPAA